MSKFCKDCVHFTPKYQGSQRLDDAACARCSHPRFLSLVTGEVEPQLCSLERALDSTKHCGAEGHFFELKGEPTGQFIPIRFDRAFKDIT